MEWIYPHEVGQPLDTLAFAHACDWCGEILRTGERILRIVLPSVDRTAILCPSLRCGCHFVRAVTDGEVFPAMLLSTVRAEALCYPRANLVETGPVKEEKSNIPDSAEVRASRTSKQWSNFKPSIEFREDKNGWTASIHGPWYDDSNPMGYGSTKEAAEKQAIETLRKV